MSMAIPKVKATYALDPETLRRLERMARRWGVSKSEALRRAIRSAAEPGSPQADGGLEVLDRLQGVVALTREGSRRWARAIRAERRASSARREPGEA